MSRILVTGASGFVGRSLLQLFRSVSLPIRAASRRPLPGGFADVEWFPYELGEWGEQTAMLDGVETVVHLAARVHRMGSRRELLEKYRHENTEGTRRLAERAARAGVKRFIFLSTIKVNGEKTAALPGGKFQRFTEQDTPGPEDPYAISKYEAERAIKTVCEDSGMDYVILRPPLIYGPGVKANFLHLIDVIDKGIPLPLGSIHNRRSLLYVENLGQVILRCMERPAVANRLYLVSDADISVPELIKAIGRHLGRRFPVFPFPVSLLKVAGKLTEKQAAIARLTDSLVMDNTRIKQDLDWTPRFDLGQGLQNTIYWYRSRKKDG